MQGAPAGEACQVQAQAALGFRAAAAGPDREEGGRGTAHQPDALGGGDDLVVLGQGRPEGDLGAHQQEKSGWKHDGAAQVARPLPNDDGRERGARRAGGAGAAAFRAGGAEDGGVAGEGLAEFVGRQGVRKSGFAGQPVACAQGQQVAPPPLQGFNWVFYVLLGVFAIFAVVVYIRVVRNLKAKSTAADASAIASQPAEQDDYLKRMEEELNRREKSS